MKIVVIGGSGLIGTKLIKILRARGHDAVAASPGTGVNALTGEGLAAALDGADKVVDVANSPSFEDKAALDFFKTATGNLLAYEAAAGVKHHVALSVVGSDRLPDNGYLRAKAAQEALIKASPVPYTIVRATQFFEFAGGIAHDGADGDRIRVSSALFQPIVSDDVAEALAEATLAPPVHGTIEVAGPEKLPMSTLVETWLRANGDDRKVIADPSAPYFGTPIDDRSLTPGPDARIMPTRFTDWLAQSAAKGGERRHAP